MLMKSLGSRYMKIFVLYYVLTVGKNRNRGDVFYFLG